MAQDQVDSELTLPLGRARRVPSVEILHHEMPCCRKTKEFGRKALKNFFNRLRLRKAASANISNPDPTYKVAYLGNVPTGWAKGEGCVEKPLATLWRNYMMSSRPDVRMQLTVSGGGLRATTKDHGLTEYWANRLTYCSAPCHFPKLFCWVYRHEGRKLKNELRCHAVLCGSVAVARQIEVQLRTSLTQALAEFKRDKISRQNARLSLVNCVYDNPTIPRRKILLSTGSQNYRPPLERSKSAPKLTMIEEHISEEEESGAEERERRHCDTRLKLRLPRPCPTPGAEERKEVSFHPCDPGDDEEPVCAEVEARNERLLEEMLAESLDMKRETWFRPQADMLPLDSDEGSLSSGCESASTVTSDMDQPSPAYAIIAEATDEHHHQHEGESRKTEIDFKLGGTVLARVRSLERLANCAKYKRTMLMAGDADEVSLIPVGEATADFSSLKVYKKKERDVRYKEEDENEGDEDGEASGSEGENDSACSDESGYAELLDCTSAPAGPTAVSKVVLV